MRKYCGILYPKSTIRCASEAAILTSYNKRYYTNAPATRSPSNDGKSENTSSSPHPSASSSSEKLIDEGKQQPGLFSIIREEFGKLFRYVAYDVAATAESSAKSVKSYADTMTDNNLSPEEKEKRRKKEEAYHAVLAKQQQQAAAAEAAKTANMTWTEKLKYNLQSLKQATSPKQGMASLVQHCAAAHAAEVAVEQGIDVKNIQVVLEQVKKQDGIGFETKVVGYIDAPKASEEEVYQFAERLKKACPAAGMMEGSMDWRKVGSDAPLGAKDLGDVAEGKSVEGSSVDSIPFTPKQDWSSSASFPSSFAKKSNLSAQRDMDTAEAQPAQSSKNTTFDNPFQRLHILKDQQKHQGGEQPMEGGTQTHTPRATNDKKTGGEESPK